MRVMMCDCLPCPSSLLLSALAELQLADLITGGEYKALSDISSVNADFPFRSIGVCSK